MTIGSFDVVLYTCIFLLPGFIMKSIIDAFVPPQKFREAKYFLTCLLYSVINCALLSWLYIIISSLYREHPYWYWIVLLLVNIGGAVILGVLTGAIRKFDVVDRLFSKVWDLQNTSDSDGLGLLVFKSERRDMGHSYPNWWSKNMRKIFVYFLCIL